MGCESRQARSLIDMPTLEKIKKPIVIISIVSAVVGAALIGASLTPSQIQEVAITETKMEIPEEYYNIVTVGIADKYEAFQLDSKKEKINMNEARVLIESWNRKAQELKGMRFTNVNTSKHSSDIVTKLNNYLRINKEN